MWVTTLAEIADHTARTVQDVRLHDRFEVPAFPDATIRLNGQPVARADHAPLRPLA